MIFKKEGGSTEFLKLKERECFKMERAANFI